MSVKFSLLSKTKILLSRSIINLTKPIATGFADDKSSEDKLDFYSTLGLKSSATNVEIKKAYYDLTKKYHPDRNEGNKDASKKFREVAEAYEILGNYGMRKRYDKGLPLPLIKNQPVRSPIVEKEVKYQKFFDSRGTQQKFDWQQSNEEEEEKPSKKQLYYEERRKRIEAEAADSSKMQYLVAFFICVIVFLTQVVYKK